MSAATGEQGHNSTAATTEIMVYPWRPIDANQFHGGHGILWGPPDPSPEKPKRKSKWLLKQMGRRGHQR